MSAKPHTLSVRADRWEAIEKKAWKLSTAASKIIKPTDIADALLWKGIESLSLEDIENAKKERGKENKGG
jgi:hypothetical protein